MNTLRIIEQIGLSEYRLADAAWHYVEYKARAEITAKDAQTARIQGNLKQADFGDEQALCLRTKATASLFPGALPDTSFPLFLVAHPDRFQTIRYPTRRSKPE